MILVTGGAGFIGSSLVKELNDRGLEDILIVDRLESNQKWVNLRGLKFSEYVDADEFFLEKYSYLLKKVSLIFHMGACADTTETDVDYLMENNYRYSIRLFEYARKNKIKIIYASSAATYGAGEMGHEDSHDLIDQLRPLNPYGYSKQAFDQWVLKQKDVPPVWIGLKFFNVYGPQEYHKDNMQSVVSKAHKQIKETGKVRLFKSHVDGIQDGDQRRDFVYVKDVVRAMVLFSELNQSDISGIYNLGSGKAQSFKELAMATFKALNCPPSIEYFDMPENIREQYQYFTQANMSKLHKVLKDFEFSDLENGVADYVKNYLESDDPYY